MRRLPFLVILATYAAACDQAAPSTGSAEPKIAQTEVIDPASVPTPEAPQARKPLPTDPPVAPPPAEIAPDAAPAEADPGPKPKAKLGDVELVSAGAEPRYALRYQPTKGATEALTMSTTTTMSMPPEPALVFPTMLLDASVVALDVSANGTMTLEITITGVDAKADADSKIPIDQVKAQMKDVVGLKTTLLVDAHGRMTDLDGAAIQQVEQTQMGLNQLAAALPAEPVGKGAKWRIKQKIDQGELKLDQTVTFEVLEVTATTAKLKSTGKMSAPPQKIDWQGQKVDLDRTTGSSVATMTIDFTRLVPEVRGNVEMTMRMNAGAEKASMTTKSKMSMHAKKK